MSRRAKGGSVESGREGGFRVTEYVGEGSESFLKGYCSIIAVENA